jgi:hydrogenase/urease accessory protein HupE
MSSFAVDIMLLEPLTIRMKKTFSLLFFCLLPFLPLSAHPNDVSFFKISVLPNRLEGFVALNFLDLKALGADLNKDGKISYSELHATQPKISSFIQDNFLILADYQSVSYKLTQMGIQGATEKDDFSQQQNLEVLERDFLGFRALYYFNAPLAKLPAKLMIQGEHFKSLPGTHSTVISLWMGDDVQSGAISEKRPSLSFSTGGESSLSQQIISFIRLGIEHIFEGRDHILFLIALIIIGSRLWELVKIVTAFTIAHSITLILAALGWVSLPTRLIESAIALTIVYVAVENFVILRGKNQWMKQNRWLLTGIFGLVHGFGFANVLKNILPDQGLVPSLLAFNIGVEIGQICIILVAFPIVLWIAKQTFQKKFIYAVSAIVLVFGIYWFIERTF